MKIVKKKKKLKNRNYLNFQKLIIASFLLKLNNCHSYLETLKILKTRLQKLIYQIKNHKFKNKKKTLKFLLNSKLNKYNL